MRALSAPVRATYDPDLSTAGSWFIDEDGDFVYRCPCGCGARGALIVGVNFKPDITPSWRYNGIKEAATLYPSVHHVGHWHGWLTDGWWRDA